MEMESPPFQKHPSLYFKDGDIDIRCPSELGPPIMFRVDKVFLSRHSPIFRDMLSLPLTPQIETHDGAPLVDIPDDAQDMEGLLNAVYNPATLTYQRHDPDTPLRAMETLRLATKYGIDSIRNLIIRHIEADWPKTLKEWDSFSAEMKSLGADGEPHADDVFPEPASAIRLALDFDCPSILPAAFYMLSSLAFSQDWDKIRRSQRRPRAKLSVRWNLLNQSDLLRLGRGREKLFKKMENIRLLAGLAETADGCEYGVDSSDEEDEHMDELSPECPFNKAMDDACSRAFRLYQDPYPDVLGILQYLSEFCRGYRECRSCAYLAEKAYKATRQESWDRLSKTFELRQVI